MTAKESILEVLSKTTDKLAIHEFPFVGYNQAAISARLRELAREGKVVGTPRPGKAFKEWSLRTAGELPLEF
jgi:hypothetical protein